MLGKALVNFCAPVVAGAVRGAIVMTGGAIAVAGAKRVAQRTPYGTVLAGPLDNFGTLLDPLDLFGFRKKKEDQQKAMMAQSEAASREADKKRKAAEKKAKLAEKKAAEAEKKAAKAEREAREAKERGQAGTARQKQQEAMQKRRWAQMARHAASNSRKADNPDIANSLALAAVEIVKNAANPPRTAADLLTADMLPGAKSLLIDMVDQVNRMGSEPDYDGIMNRMASGDTAAFEDFADLAVDYDDYLSGVAGPQRDEYALLLAPEIAERGRRIKAGLPVKEPVVAGPCCTGCAMGMGCGGEKVPEGMIDGSAHGGREWEGVGSFDGYGDDDEGLGGNVFLATVDDDDDPMSAMGF